MNSNDRNIAICFAITISILIWFIVDKLNDNRVMIMLALFPFFCLAILLAVFGKDLFKRSDTKESKSNN